MKQWLATAALVLVSGCPSIGRDSGETQGQLPPIDGPTVEFDPANSIIPFPNNLVINPATGKVDIPAPACETPTAKALREGVLNTLDGFGTYEAAMQVTFTDDVDPASLQGNVVMYQRTNKGAAVSPMGATPVPTVVIPSTALRFNAADCTMPAQIHAATIVPLIPLTEKSTYTVALLSGIKTTAGKPYIPSFTWALIRQTKDPVTLADGCDYNNPTSCTVLAEQTPLNPAGDANNNGVPDIIELVGLDRLWKAEAQGLAFLDAATGNADRSRILVAWEVTTQTTTDQLDASVADSPAAMVSSGPFVPGTTHSVAQGNARAFIELVYQKIGAASSPAQAQQICTQVGCDAVGDVLGAGLATMNFQTHIPNTYAPGGDIPGPWSDPVHATIQDPFTVPSVGVPGVIPVLAFVPAGPMPANGWPVVVFGHGLSSQKESLFVIAPQLASAGFASVAIDFVDHGDRAVRVTAEPTLGCSRVCAQAATACSVDTDCPTGDVCGPTFAQAPQCFEPFLTTNLAQTRDNVRQTVLDLQRLSHAVKACGTTMCDGFQVDPAHVEYLGISLGGIIGSTTTATDADLKTSVLNVEGVGWLDILENTQTLEIKCPLVNGLIDAGVIQGTKWDPAMPTVGTCLTDDWKKQPGYQQFSAAARWILDPADGANFTPMLATHRFMIQEVIGDQVVPNLATENLGKLEGLMPQQADPMLPNSPASAAVTMMPMTNKWLQYPTLPADAGTGFPGNTFWHASLLKPANSGNDGLLGTARVQKDAITYLFLNQ